MQLFAGKPVQVRVGVPADIEAALERLFGSAGGEVVQSLGDMTELGAEDDVERLRDLASEAPVIRFVNRLIARAVELRASDIHIEPVRAGPAGALPDRRRAARDRAAARPAARARSSRASRSWRGSTSPSAGCRRTAASASRCAARRSTCASRPLPTMHGEAWCCACSIAAAWRSTSSRSASSPRRCGPYREALTRPNGIILVTGPTGSGKTTTLYASLIELNTPDRKLLTVEDPIEYQLDGVNQVQIKPQIGLTFAHVLRSILRHDPDIIMIGEIRDLETAQIAIQAALTGHLVLSTLHTNNAASTLTRLLDMGVEDYLLTSTLNGIVAQRLVRRLCEHCREPYTPLPELLAQLGLAGPQQFWRPKGCAACAQTGYSGRISINEILIMTDLIRRQILQHAESNELQRAAIAAGMRPMLQDGIAKVAAGVTSVEEVMRVTREIE